MCKVLKVSRSSYYKFLNKTESKRTIENKGFEERILSIYEESKKRYGAPKIHEILTGGGATISLKRVQRLMKKLGIESIIIKRFRPYSSKEKIQERENILKQEGLSWHEVAAIGDDLNDYNMLKRVGLSFTPANGTHYLKEFVNVICTNKGGEGAVREMLEYIFKEDGLEEES